MILRPATGLLKKTPAYRQAGICGVAPAYRQVLRRMDQGAGQNLFIF